ncbi:MAG TPA: penicillin-binding protein [Enterococcus columbae]|nr:penicillin-binding protein [Enterococcus columbae]
MSSKYKKFKDFIRKKNQSTTNNRKKVGIIFFSTAIALFFLFAIRISYIVLVGKVGDVSLKEKTAELYKGSEIIPAKRGTIYDRNGVAIAEDATSYSAYVIFSKNYVQGKKKLYAENKDLALIAQVLNQQTGIDQASVLKVLNNAFNTDPRPYQVEISAAKNITLQQKETIEAELKRLGGKGLYFNDHPSRIYPNGQFSSHLIGYADIETKDNQERLVGKLGIEEAYNNVLKGTDGKITYQKDNYQNPLPGTVAEKKAAVDGKDIYTTIDSRLQSYLDTLLTAAYQKNKPENMTGVLMNAKTGEILAAAQQPSFNPEDKSTLGGEDFTWLNLLLQDTYEPGSTMKILTTSAAIDQGIFNENETFNSGAIKIADTTIDDWDHGKLGTLTMRQALSWSSNKGMVILEQRMQDRWQRYLEQFGFGQTTNAGILGESSGILPEDNVVSKAMSAFGQGIAVTNFQMLQAFTAVSNNGTMVKPHFIKEIVDTTTNKKVVTNTEVVGKPISENAARKVREYMRDVIESQDYGSAYGKYSVPGYNIAAKTGTAQVASQTGGYLKGENDYLYSIVLMIPAEEPEYVLYLTIKLPKEYDGTALPSVANPLLKRAMDLLDTDQLESSEVEKSNEKITIDNYQGMSAIEAANQAEKKGLEVIVLGSGEKITAQSIKAGIKVLPNEKIILKTDSDQYYMPDVSGWSKVDLIKLTSMLDLKIKLEGSGYCVSQSIEPYETITGDTLSFTLKEN